MGECYVCGERSLSFTCNHCGGSFCSNHRLPEKHQCSGLQRSTSGRSLSTTSSGGGTSSSSLLGGLVLLLLVSPFWLLWKGLSLLGRVFGSSRLLAALAVGIVLGAFVLPAGVVPTGGSGFDPGGVVPNIQWSGPNTSAESPARTPGSTATARPTSTDRDTRVQPTSEPFERIVERAIHEAVNDVRREHGRSPLNNDTRLVPIARDHSETMASEGEIFHTGSDGTMADRYEARGYDCRVPVGDNTYLTGAENVAKSWYLTSIATDGGREFYATPAEVGRAVAEQWLNSEGHRENLLHRDWRREGIGVEIVVERGNYAVYVTQNFC